MKTRQILIILTLSLLIFNGCISKKDSYYEIPKSEVVDVSSADKSSSNVPENDDAVNKVSNEVFNYKNDRFGFSIDIPDFLKAEGESEDGEGTYFESADGDVYLSVYGSYYPSFYYGDSVTLDEIYSDYLAEMSYTPSFVDKGYNWYQVKWKEEDTVYIKKYYLKSDNTDNELIISYPLSMEKKYEDTVEKIIASFATGIGYDSGVEE